MGERIRIYLLDDHLNWLRGVEQQFNGAPDLHIVGQCTDPVIGLEEVLKNINEIDVVITDYEMPKIPGHEVCRTVKMSRQEVKVIMMTNFDTRTVISKCRSAGADGFVFKSAGDDETFSVIRDVYSGKRLLYDLEPKGLRTDFPRVDLTPAEIEVVKLIGCKCMTTAQAAEVLCRSTHTIETHRKNIMAALEIHTVQELVHFAIYNGYCTAD